MRKKTYIILIIATLVLSVTVTVMFFPPCRPKPEIEVIQKPKEIIKPLISPLFKEHIFIIKEKKQDFENIVNIRKKGDLYYFDSREIKGKYTVTEAKLNMDFETIEWKFSYPKKNINVVAVRKGNKIFLTGTFDNKENNKKEINIDERKWQQVYQLGLMKFAVKEVKGKSVEFWCLNPNEPGNAMVIAATKEGQETITVNGNKTETARLRICLAGLLSVFWTGDYWFRLSDGFFVKAKVSGDLFVELKEEKQKK